MNEKKFIPLTIQLSEYHADLLVLLAKETSRTPEDMVRYMIMAFSENMGKASWRTEWEEEMRKLQGKPHRLEILRLGQWIVAVAAICLFYSKQSHKWNYSKKAR